MMNIRKNCGHRSKNWLIWPFLEWFLIDNAVSYCFFYDQWWLMNEIYFREKKSKKIITWYALHITNRFIYSFGYCSNYSCHIEWMNNNSHFILKAKIYRTQWIKLLFLWNAYCPMRLEFKVCFNIQSSLDEQNIDWNSNLMPFFLHVWVESIFATFISFVMMRFPFYIHCVNLSFFT